MRRINLNQDGYRPPVQVVNIINSGSIKEETLEGLFDWFDGVVIRKHGLRVAEEMRPYYLDCLPADIATRIRLCRIKDEKPPDEIKALLSSGALDEQVVKKLVNWLSNISGIPPDSDEISTLLNGEIRHKIIPPEYGISVFDLLSSYAEHIRQNGSKKYAPWQVGICVERIKSEGIETVNQLLVQNVSSIFRGSRNLILRALEHKYSLKLKNEYSAENPATQAAILRHTHIPLREVLEKQVS